MYKLKWQIDDYIIPSFLMLCFKSWLKSELLHMGIFRVVLRVPTPKSIILLLKNLNCRKNRTKFNAKPHEIPKLI